MERRDDTKPGTARVIMRNKLDGSLIPSPMIADRMALRDFLAYYRSPNSRFRPEYVVWVQDKPPTTMATLIADEIEPDTRPERFLMFAVKPGRR
jgi:hypothetical protein